MVVVLLVVASVFAQEPASAEPGHVAPVKLRCEYLESPVGVDARQPRLSWLLDSDHRGARQTAYRIRVSSTRDGLREAGDLWDSGRVESSEQNQIVYAGLPLRSHQACYWSVQVWDENDVPSPWSAPASWSMGILAPEDWSATWITAPDGVAQSEAASGPLPIFRRAFQVGKPVRRALLYACGLGFQELRLNGQKVGDSEYEPGWTNYRKTCLYTANDVTTQINVGENVLGVMLGNGLYNVAGGRYVKFKGSFGQPKLILHLRLEYEDGTSESVATDASWKAARGPVTFSCIYGGEDYDAREEKPGWDTQGYDDSDWASATATEGPGGRLSSAAAPPIKVIESFAPVSVKRLVPGKYIYDMGQNLSGRPRIKVQGPEGASIKLIPGELLDEAGLVTQRSSGGPVWFSYTLKGKGEEEWRPRFACYGFRYLQVEGIRPAAAEEGENGLPRLLEVASEFTHSSADAVGQFECSNPLVNRIHKLILASIRSNLQSVLTDCPHREKLGWLEVSHLLSDGLMYNFDLARFYGKVQQDMADSQLDNGLVPDIAPEYTVFNGGFRDSPEWGSASLVNPWNVWLMYGDRRPIESHFDAMKRYAEYLGLTASNHIISHGLGDWYDIGPGDPGESKLTSKGVTATAVYYQDLCVLRDAAKLVGRNDDAIAAAALADDVRDAFNRAFYHADIRSYDRGSQTANAMPLALGLVEDAERQAVASTLAEAIQQNGYRVTAGDVGFSYLVRALTDSEQGDLLYRIVCQDEGPGYAYQLKQGATTLTEAWDADPHSSQIHCMLGHVDGWFYRGLAGIRVDPAAPGFRHFVLKPQMPQGLDWVKADYQSVRGAIKSEWRKGDGRVTWSVRIPPNSIATVFVPNNDVKSILEGGKPIAEVAGIGDVRTESRNTLLEAVSGDYTFEWPI